MTGKAFEGAMIAGAWVSLVLDFVGWVLLLSGVSAMQQVGAMRIHQLMEI